MFKMYFRVPIFVVALVGLLCGGSIANADDLATLQKRFTEHLLATKPCAEAEQFRAAQKPDGSWADADYNDRSKVDWSPEVHHLNRLVQMAVAYRTPTSPAFENAKMLDGIDRGLTFFVKTNPPVSNQYVRAIGAPMLIGEVLVLTRDKLDPVTQKLAIGWAGLGIRADGYSRGGERGNLEEAADVARLAYVHLTISMTTGDVDAITTAGQRIEAAARVVSKAKAEGLRPDGSYHYHGPQIYCPGYISAHMSNTALWAGLFAQTKWAFGAETQTFLRKGSLEGMAWMARRGYWDPFVMGRQISKIDHQKTELTYLEPLKISDPSHAADYTAFFEHNLRKNDSFCVGNKYFNESDYMSHRRPSFMMTVRMVSKRTESQESGNGENVKSLWLSQGTTAIMADGSEYDRIFPVWNWRYIPGTTTSDVNGKRTDWGSSGETTFVGAASDGKNGVAAMDLHAEESRKRSGPEVLGKKSWFMFDDKMIALGAGIHYNGSNNPIVTTVNQARRVGPVMTSAGPATATAASSSAEQKLDGVKWVWHANIGYIFPQSQKVRLRNENKVKGDWSTINSGKYSEKGVYTETIDRFTLTIDHGDLKDDSNAGYAYIVMPGKSQSDFEQKAADSKVEIISNTPDLAAVRDRSSQLCGAVFYDSSKNDSVNFGDSLSVKVSNSLIMLVDLNGPSPVVTLNSPTGEAIGQTTFHYPNLEAVQIGNKPLAVASRAADSLTVNVPAGAGPITLITNGAKTKAATSAVEK